MMSNESSSLFDFGVLARDYDSWYDTPAGQVYDRQEKAAAFRLLPRPWPDARLLEVGCGTGHWSRFFAEQGFEVFGLDVSPEMVEVARSRKLPHCHFEIGDACHLPTGNSTFQVVAAMAALEFVSEPETAVAGMCRCVAHGGSVLIGTLNRLATVNRERVANGEEPYASAHLFSPAELRRLLSQHGRIRMDVSSAGTTSGWLRPVRRLCGQFLLRCGKAAGALIVAQVRC